MKSKSGRSSRVERGPSARTNPYAAAIEILEHEAADIELCSEHECERRAKSYRAAILLLEAAGKMDVFADEDGNICIKSGQEDTKRLWAILKAIYDAHKGAGK